MHSSKHRDQVSKVYQWEDQWIHWNSQAFSDLKGPRQWMRWATKKYAVPYISIRETHRDYSFFRPHDRTIYLIKKHWNPVITLHEVSHYIHEFYFGEAGHGDKWLGIYLWLLEAARIAPREALRASAKAYGLKFSTMMTPKVLKQTKVYKKQHKKKKRGR